MAMMVCGIPECYRPRNQRGGFVHDFCSRTHAQEAADRGMIPPIRPPHGDCHRCQLHGCHEEVFFDEETNRVHDFCSRTHADIAMSRGEWPPPGTQGSSGCQLPGCNRWVYSDPYTGEESAFCGRSHYEQAEQAAEAAHSTKCGFYSCPRPAWVDQESGNQLTYCGVRCAHASGAHHLLGQLRCSLPGCNDVMMRHELTMAELGYCSDNHRVKAEERRLAANTTPHVDRTFRGGPMDDFKLSVLTKQHPKYPSLKDQFLQKFQKDSHGLRVERIFQIQVPADVSAKFRAHEQMVGNTNRRFHGTACSTDCNFFVDLRGGPCGRQDCNVCSICTHGFALGDNVGGTAQQTNFNLRYGQGLYFSSVSGKANDYAHKSEKVGRHGKKWRCMFVCNVAVGRSYNTYEGYLPPHLCPPSGFDSVIGEVGQELNYDEVVVYNEDAALPTYLLDGIVHDFCSRTHAQEAADRGMIAQLRRPHGNCHRCQLHGCNKEVFFDEGANRVHDFCSLRHASMAMSRGQWPPPGTQGSSSCQLPGCDQLVYRNPSTGEESAFCSRSHSAQAADAAARPPVCRYQPCTRLAWIESGSGDRHSYCGSRCAGLDGAHQLVGQMKCSLPGCNGATMVHGVNGTDLGYCCNIHRLKAEERSLCQNPESHVDRTFRGGRSDDFKLSVLTNQHHSYSSLKDQFLQKFQKPVDGLRVERIFKIQVPGEVQQKHKAYRDTMTNTRRRFHGTSCSDDCQFFVDLRGGPCGKQECRVCSICTHGFKLSKNLGSTARRTGVNLRYGEGLYFSSVSGKANDYAEPSQKAGPRGKKWRCMFICNVAVGRAYCTKELLLPPENCPPSGYDSVVGEVSPGGLNYDEVVVYNEDAALPSNLIVYSFY
eukprot:g6189.t1